MAVTETLCLCDGRYAGCNHQDGCDEAANGPWSPHFCPACDTRRVEHIDKAFEAIGAEFDRTVEPETRDSSDLRDHYDNTDLSDQMEGGVWER